MLDMVGSRTSQCVRTRRAPFGLSESGLLLFGVVLVGSSGCSSKGQSSRKGPDVRIGWLVRCVACRLKHSSTCLRTALPIVWCGQCTLIPPPSALSLSLSRVHESKRSKIISEAELECIQLANCGLTKPLVSQRQAYMRPRNQRMHGLATETPNNEK